MKDLRERSERLLENLFECGAGSQGIADRLFFIESFASEIRNEALEEAGQLVLLDNSVNGDVGGCFDRICALKTDALAASVKDDK